MSLTIPEAEVLDGVTRARLLKIAPEFRRSPYHGTKALAVFANCNEPMRRRIARIVASWVTWMSTSDNFAGLRRAVSSGATWFERPNWEKEHPRQDFPTDWQPERLLARAIKAEIARINPPEPREDASEEVPPRRAAASRRRRRRPELPAQAELWPTAARGGRR